MLQIISGKFFDSDERFHNDCKGILYSNVSYYGKRDLGYIKLESVESHNNISSYVISYDNQLQILPASFQMVKVGDDEIIRQVKNILSFGLDSVFDENKAAVERVCRIRENGNGHRAAPCDFIKNTLDFKRDINDKEMETCELFFKQMIGLKRTDYINALNCIIAYNASIRLLNEDLSLAYSMLVFCLESLSQRYDNYEPVWNDYNQNKKGALEKIFVKLSEEDWLAIKEILIKDEHLKLSSRFKDFVYKYVDVKFYDKINEYRVIHKDDMERALLNSYNTRSKFAHMLQPVIKQLNMDDISKKSDTFSFMHDIYFTYSGLLRLVRTVILNFVYSLETVQSEKFDWYNDLPGIFEIEAAPYFWIWNPDLKTGDTAEKRLEGFIQCLVYYRNNIPNLNDLVKTYFESLSEMKEANRRAAYILGYLYTKVVKNTVENKELYERYIKKYNHYLGQCDLYNMILIAMAVPLSKDIEWKIEDCEKVIEDYNKKKYKSSKIRLPNEIETIMYLVVANGAREESKEKQMEWLWKAYYNSNNNESIQEKIKETIKSADIFDITFIWDTINSRFEKKDWYKEYVKFLDISAKKRL